MSKGERKTCARCGTPLYPRLYCVSLIHQDGLQDGEHLADVDLCMCGRCADIVADALLDFCQRDSLLSHGAGQPWRMPSRQIALGATN